MSFSKVVTSPLNPLFHYNFGRKVCAACCLLRAQVATWLAVVWSNPIVKRTHHSVLTYEPANLDAPSSSLFHHIDYQDDSSKSSNQAIFFCIWIHVMFPWIVLINVGLILVLMMFFCYYFFARIGKSCFCSTKLRINTELFSAINTFTYICLKFKSKYLFNNASLIR